MRRMQQSEAKEGESLLVHTCVLSHLLKSVSVRMCQGASSCLMPCPPSFLSWGSARAGLCPCLAMPLPLLLLLLLLLLPLLLPYLLAVFASPPPVYATAQWQLSAGHKGP